MCRSPTRGSSKTRFGTSTHFLEMILRRSHRCLVVTNTRCIWWECLYNCTNPATLDAVLKARLLLFTTLLMLQTNLDLPGQSSPRRILRYSMKLLLSLWSKHEKSHHSGLPTFCQLYVTLLVWNWARLLVATWPSCYQCSTEIDQCDFSDLQRLLKNAAGISDQYKLWQEKIKSDQCLWFLCMAFFSPLTVAKARLSCSWFISPISSPKHCNGTQPCFSSEITMAKDLLGRTLGNSQVFLSEFSRRKIKTIPKLAFFTWSITLPGHGVISKFPTHSHVMEISWIFYQSRPDLKWCKWSSKWSLWTSSWKKS